MPIRDDEKRRAYFREYMRRRRAGAGTDAEALRRLKASAAEGKPRDELARQIRDAWGRCKQARERMEEDGAEMIKLTAELLPHYEKLLAENEALVRDYNEPSRRLQRAARRARR